MRRKQRQEGVRVSSGPVAGGLLRRTCGCGQHSQGTCRACAIRDRVPRRFIQLPRMHEECGNRCPTPLSILLFWAEGRPVTRRLCVRPSWGHRWCSTGEVEWIVRGHERIVKLSAPAEPRTNMPTIYSVGQPSWICAA